MKIGMLTSGGDCQGLNAALRGVAKALYQEFGTAVTIYGIRDGYRGLIEGDYHPMEPQVFSDILTRGGTILGTSRQPFKTMQQAEENEAIIAAAANALENIASTSSSTRIRRVANDALTAIRARRK